MEIASDNLLDRLPPAAAVEVFDTLAEAGQVRIERITSQGQAAPPDHWDAQPRAEWVVVLRGRARLRFKSPDQTIEMGPMDWVLIPPRTRHRVEWCDPDRETVWLAVHFPGD